MIEVRLGEVPLELHPSGAAFERTTGRLLVADLHLGKGATLRSAGLPIPGGTSMETLQRVAAAINAVGRAEVRELWVLGDLVHARAGLDQELVTRVADWIEDLPGGRLHLVRGNHDRGAGRLPGVWSLVPHDEPHVLSIGADRLHLVHDPAGTPEPSVGGHLHPTVRVGQGRRRGPKVPAFLGRSPGRSQGRSGADGTLISLVLPALGALVDGAVVRAAPGLQAWACGEGQVVALPPGGW